MNRYARIEKGFVVELFSTEGNMVEMFHSAMVWVPVPDGLEVDTGWSATQGPTVWTFMPPVLSLATAQAAQIAVLNAACAAAIVAGQTSNALGAPHIYPSGATDQTNLTANVLSSLFPGLPTGWTTQQLCADTSGNWAYLLHTVTQIQQVDMDVKESIQFLLTKNADYKSQVSASTTVAAVKSINWQ